MRKTLSKVWGRRRLLALVGLGAGVAAKAGLGTDETARASGPLVGVNGYAGSPDGMADGVQGYAVGANNAGTFGRNNDLNGVGVYGAAPSGTGVHGESASGTAVGARSASGHAVYASSTSGFGVLASSTNSYGVWGQASGNQAAGVVGWSNGASSYGVIGQAGPAGTSGTAGYFYGPVVVIGAFTVTGGPKSAAVPHPDGSHRRMYCLESPESMFEDTGGGQLVGGRAQVPLDADFAAVVTTSAYQVFLTPEGDCKGLYVASKSPAGFEVRELQGGTSAIPFSYRVVAKRRDLSAGRMERVTVRQPSELLAPPAVPPGSSSTGSPGVRAAPTPTPTRTP